MRSSNIMWFDYSRSLNSIHYKNQHINDAEHNSRSFLSHQQKEKDMRGNVKVFKTSPRERCLKCIRSWPRMSKCCAEALSTIRPQLSLQFEATSWRAETPDKGKYSISERDHRSSKTGQACVFKELYYLFSLCVIDQDVWHFLKAVFLSREQNRAF